MKSFKSLLSFNEVAKEIGCDSGDIRGLVVEERRLPAVLVTLVGHKEPYDMQLMNIGSDGMAFDLARDLGGTEHIGHLRVERVALDRFMSEVGIPSAAASSVQPVPIAAERKLSSKEETTYLNIVAVLLELIKAPRANRTSDSDVIQEMLDNYSEKQGISQRTLQEKFAAAKRSLQQ